LCDRSQERSEALAQEIGAEAYASQADAANGAEVVVLAVKPKDLPGVAKAISGSVTRGQLVVSILAGTSLATLKRHFSKAHVLRMMPNLGVVCGKGVIGLVEDPDLLSDLRTKAEDLFASLGLVYWLPEDKVDALTALASSGIAFVAALIEAMVDSGSLLGFTAAESLEFVLKTVEGSVALLQTEKKSPGELKRQVASPGGTTEAGLKVLEERKMREILIDAYASALKRAKEMHRETESDF
jgi:pyrroline-5-carboxylate reductase